MNRFSIILTTAFFHFGLIAAAMFVCSRFRLFAFSFSIFVYWSATGIVTACIMTIFSHWKLPVRQLLAEEEKLLMPIFNEVRAQVPGVARCQLWLELSPVPNAFVSMPGKIVVSPMFSI